MADETKDQEETAEEVETSEAEETEESEASEEVEASETEEESSEAADDEADDAAGAADDEDESDEDEAEESEAEEADEDDAEESEAEEADEDDAEPSEAEESEAEEAEESEAEEADEDEEDEDEAPAAVEADPNEVETLDLTREAQKAAAADGAVAGVAAFFEHPAHLLYAAEETRDSDYEKFDAFSPFPIHGMDDALGVGRSWIPWVTFFAGATGFTIAASLQFGIMGFDWPMVYGGKPFIAWPSFVPIMFELTVLLAGVTTGLVMLIAAGCFRKPFIIDPDITNDRFVLWISADDPRFKRDGVIDYMKGLNPSEIRTVRRDQK